MKITHTASELHEAIQSLLKENPKYKIGFVPTMGALHEGHLSLIAASREQCDITVCSIFVNPTQFNNLNDLATYPRTIEEDTALLINQGCDILFVPTEREVYPEGVPNYTIDLEGLDHVMEGPSRPGHFEGVCMVVERFFELVNPDFGFFGLKDFQQVAIIRKMVAVRELPITIISVPIKRNEKGLALSSRNALLTPEQREEATLIYTALSSGLAYAKENQNAEDIKAHIAAFFEISYLAIEYIAIVDNNSLQDVTEVNENSSVCAVVHCGNVRLIDNMQFASVFQ